MIIDFFSLCVSVGSPVTRWSSIAFGAGIGIGSAYTDCSRFFDASSSSTSATLLATKSTESSVSQVSRDFSSPLLLTLIVGIPIS